MPPSASSWELTLVISASLPFLIVAGALQAHFVVGFSADSKKMYAVSSQMASDAVGNIRTVAAFGLQDRMIDLYKRAQSGPSKNEQKRGHVAGIAFGFSQWVMFAMYSLAFWYGGGWIDDGKGTFDDVLRVFFAILMTGFGVSQAAMTFPSVAKAQGAINSIFGVLDRKPEIDSSSPDGMLPRDVTGRVELKGVDFSYPSRPGVQVAKQLSLTVEPGQTVALVGESGSGKSTVVSLLQRFYNPDAGSITIDGADIKSLNLRWLRGQIGLVSQEPTLFSTTIRENIMHGREGATDAEVEEAAKVANAYDFIMQLPQKFETEVGERGIQLSGGQKQRVAIARAVLRNPKILLLDEATSALDNESEQIVQDALDKMMVGRSSIVIAHRLSTIRDADKIVVMAKGEVVEEGKYNDLLHKEGGVFAAYAILQGAQRTTG